MEHGDFGTEGATQKILNQCPPNTPYMKTRYVFSRCCDKNISSAVGLINGPGILVVRWRIETICGRAMWFTDRNHINSSFGRALRFLDFTEDTYIHK
jgi:hypothetical protein